MRDARALLAAVAEHIEGHWCVNPGSAPGHAHTVPGQWDHDKTPCHWCALWIEVKTFLASRPTTIRADAAKDEAG
jgi:hypothetical protein